MELTPVFLVRFNDSFELPKNRVISIKTNDAAGFESDLCEISLDDYDGALQMPRTEARVSVSLGYQETELVKIGSYYVKEIALDGARKLVHIKANAVSKSMRSKKTQSHDENFSDFFQSMASDFGLDAAFDNSFADIDLKNAPQFAESNLHYLTRIAQKNGAVAKVADNHVIFANNMQAKSVTGQSLPTKYIDASDVSNYDCTFKETETSGGATGSVYANWYDKNTGEYHMVHAGSGDPEIELDEIFSDEKTALAAANSRFKRVEKSNTVLNLSLSGRPDLFAESPLVLKNFPSKIPTNWIISNVQHTLDNSGFKTTLECNRQ